MAGKLGAFPFWTLNFDKQGNLLDNKTDFITDVVEKKLTDLFVFSHGWNNDLATAMNLYTGFFGEVEKIWNNPAVKKNPSTFGVAGVVWPSILFPGDTPPPNNDGGGAASFTDSSQAVTLQSELPKVFNDSEQQQTLQDLLKMIEEQPADDDKLIEFRDKLATLVTPPGSPPAQDDLEFKAVTVKDNDDWFRALDLLSVQSTGDDSMGGAADLSSFTGRLWNGAKNALRVATFWEMKHRAGIIGKTGLGPLIGEIHTKAPNLKIHLLGHSFGARLVSYALAGLPDTAVQESPVKSLFLVQGAFSHFAFADSLPFDDKRKGDLAGMAARVDGPLLTTHTLKDLAVGSAYPLAALVSGDDAADATDLLYRWEGMGHDGAQAVNSASAFLGSVTTSYPFEKGKWINLDGNQVIVNGNPPSGAHSDIIHPETAWAALAAAKVVTL